jgi:hypothetical protein
LNGAKILGTNLQDNPFSLRFIESSRTQRAPHALAIAPSGGTGAADAVRFSDCLVKVAIESHRIGAIEN